MTRKRFLGGLIGETIIFDRAKKYLFGSNSSSSKHGSQKKSTYDDKTVYLQTGDKMWPDMPKAMRTELWMSIIQKYKENQFYDNNNNDNNNNKCSMSNHFETHLTKEISEDIEFMIEKDVGRTFPECRFFQTKEGRDSMKRVLKAYAAYDTEIGYCQGMNFIVGLLLLYMPSESFAFDGLVFLMYHRKLRGFFSTDLSLLQARLWQLSKLLPSDLLNHLEMTEALPVLFAPSWFMTCFAADFPLHVSSRIMDIVICNNINAVLLKIALTILEQFASEIMSMKEMIQILNFIRTDIPNMKIFRLHEIVTEAIKKPWTPEQEAILNNSCIETVHDTILRVEDGIFSPKETSSSLIFNNLDDDNNNLSNSTQSNLKDTFSCETRVTLGNYNSSNSSIMRNSRRKSMTMATEIKEESYSNSKESTPMAKQAGMCMNMNVNESNIKSSEQSLQQQQETYDYMEDCSRSSSSNNNNNINTNSNCSNRGSHITHSQYMSTSSTPTNSYNSDLFDIHENTNLNLQDHDHHRDLPNVLRWPTNKKLRKMIPLNNQNVIEDQDDQETVKKIRSGSLSFSYNRGPESINCNMTRSFTMCCFCNGKSNSTATSSLSSTASRCPINCQINKYSDTHNHVFSQYPNTTNNSIKQRISRWYFPSYHKKYLKTSKIDHDLELEKRQFSVTELELGKIRSINKGRHRDREKNTFSTVFMNPFRRQDLGPTQTAAIMKNIKKGY